MSIELKQAAQQAIEAIQDLRGYRPDIDEAINALRTALQQTEAKKDEPVNPTHWRAVLSEPQRPHELRKHLHTVLFREWDDAESWVASKLDFEGWRYTLEPLYTHPAPGVPDGYVLVPVKATPKVAMVLYEGARNCFSPKVAECLWQDALTAAIQQTEAKKEDV